MMCHKTDNKNFEPYNISQPNQRLQPSKMIIMTFKRLFKVANEDYMKDKVGTTISQSDTFNSTKP